MGVWLLAGLAFVVGTVELVVAGCSTNWPPVSPSARAGPGC
ncbi:hypothetical protein ACP3P8_25125 [Pseudomonas aeruginosa]